MIDHGTKRSVATSKVRSSDKMQTASRIRNGLTLLLFYETLFKHSAYAFVSISHGNTLRAAPSALHETLTSSFVATCIPGLSKVLAKELIDLNCKQVETTGESAVCFAADTKTALKTILYARTAHKIMERLLQGNGLRDRDDLAAFIKEQVDVRDLLGDGKGGLLTLSVNVKLVNNVNCIPKDISHTHYSALCVKNALCDAVRDLRDDRPSVDLADPDVPLTVMLSGNAETNTADVSLYRQLHVGSLHRRGYRKDAAVHKAAMKESLAAGLLLHAKWDEKCHGSNDEKIVLMDPMAGSGTLLLEAAMIAADVAPGLMRIKCGLVGQSMPCMVRWKQQQPGERAVDLWKQILLEATDKAKTGLRRLEESEKIRIVGNEMHPGALNLFDQSLGQAGLRSVIETHQGNCRDWHPQVSPSTASWFVVTNPPWGERLSDDMHESWEDLRVFLRQTCPPGTEAWALSGNAEATKHLGLSRSASLPLKTGTQNLRWLQYLIRTPEQEAGESKSSSRAKES
ncbi:hypothetical protein MPSEU_001099400 [Mayamaea pseudoterrestris]|nr:hypothetical protein MPSEU_001099400 [Mayamaea pseudoterrestris]